MENSVDKAAKLDLWTFAGSHPPRSSSESNILPGTTASNHTASFNQLHTARVLIDPATKHNCTRNKCPFTASTLKQLQLVDIRELLRKMD